MSEKNLDITCDVKGLIRIPHGKFVNPSPPVPWGRKYFTIILPLVIGSVTYFLDFTATSPLILGLTVSLFVQNLLFHVLYSESVDRFSKTLATRPLPLRLSALFGPNKGAYLALLLVYSPGFFVVLILLLTHQIDQHPGIAIFLYSLCLSLILQPISQSVLNSESITSFTSINTIGALYLASLLLGLAGVPGIVHLVDLYDQINIEPFLYTYISYVILLSRAHHVIHISFGQKTGLAGFSISLFPLIIFLIPQVDYLLLLI